MRLRQAVEVEGLSRHDKRGAAEGKDGVQFLKRIARDSQNTDDTFESPLRTGDDEKWSI